MCFGCKEKGHNIAIYLKDEASKQVCQNWTARFGKPEYPVSVEKFQNFRAVQQRLQGDT
jgi:hypothetical protein